MNGLNRNCLYVSMDRIQFGRPWLWDGLTAGLALAALAVVLLSVGE